LAAAVLALAGALPAGEFHVAVTGRDDFPGTRAQPFATLQRAQAAVRELRQSAGWPKAGVTVRVGAGTHVLTEPLVLTPEDSGTAERPLVFAGEAGQTILSAGRRVAGWRRVEDGLWAAEVPEARERAGRFEQLWVNGTRATPARSPNAGYYYVDLPGGAGIDPATGRRADLSRRSFRARREEDLAGWSNLSRAEWPEVQLTLLWSNWISTRLRVAAVEAAERRVVLTGAPSESAHSELARGTRYFASGFRAALDAPGEWFLERAGTLLYRPRPGEDMATAEVVASRLPQWVVLAGEPRQERFVAHVVFRGLSFQHAECLTPAGGMPELQSAATVPAAILADGARSIVFEDCELARLGGYAMHFRHGCRDVIVRRCHLHDLGAGGVHLGGIGQNDVPPAWAHSSHFTIEDNLLHGGGRVHPSGSAILSHHCSDSEIRHNRISDFFYTAISVGWVWTYGPSLAQRNRIEGNHVSHIGQGVLSDLAGIYTLGTSTGTEIAGNWIHDVACYHYGAYGIYNDQGSTGIRVHHNLVHDTEVAAYMMNWGRDVTVENNLFAFPGRFAVHKGTGPEPSSLRFRRNIVLSGREGIAEGHVLKEPEFQFAQNLYWGATGQVLTFLGLKFSRWQALGKDRDSLIGDPRFADLEGRQLQPQPDGPAARIGFEPIPVAAAGVRGDAAWRARARALPVPLRAEAGPPPELTPLVLNEDFENTLLDHPPITPGTISPTWAWEAYGLRVSASDHEPADGTRCLRLVEEKPGLPGWAPALVYQPWHLRGTTRLSFQARVEREGELGISLEDRSGKGEVLHGPRVGIRRNQITLLNRPPLAIPPGSWVRVDLSVRLGPEADGTFDAVFTLADGQRHEVRRIKHRSPAWRRLDWLEFSSGGDGQSTIYLDTIRLTPNAPVAAAR
jgi:hypothetical protein